MPNILWGLVETINNFYCMHPLQAVQSPPSYKPVDFLYKIFTIFFFLFWLLPSSWVFLAFQLIFTIQILTYFLHPSNFIEKSLSLKFFPLKFCHIKSAPKIMQQNFYCFEQNLTWFPKASNRNMPETGLVYFYLFSSFLAKMSKSNGALKD